MESTPPRKRRSGSAYMTAKRKKPIQIWLTATQLDLVRRAAAVHGESMARLATAATLALSLSTLEPAEPVIDANGPAIVVAEERDGETCVFALEGSNTV